MKNLKLIIFKTLILNVYSLRSIRPRLLKKLLKRNFLGRTGTFQHPLVNKSIISLRDYKIHLNTMYRYKYCYLILKLQ